MSDPSRTLFDKLDGDDASFFMSCRLLYEGEEGSLLTVLASLSLLLLLLVIWLRRFESVLRRGRKGILVIGEPDDFAFLYDEELPVFGNALLLLASKTGKEGVGGRVELEVLSSPNVSVDESESDTDARSSESPMLLLAGKDACDSEDDEDEPCSFMAVLLLLLLPPPLGCAPLPKTAASRGSRDAPNLGDDGGECGCRDDMDVVVVAVPDVMPVRLLLLPFAGVSDALSRLRERRREVLNS